MPSTPRPRCSCGRVARYFGQFAGGVCLTHALSMIEMYPEGLSQFWPEHRQHLRDALSSAKEPL